MLLQSMFVLSSLLPFVLGSHVTRQTSNLTGASVCTSLMCIIATVNSSEVEYVLQSRGSAKLGWMAIGFGTQMSKSPMVVMWPNSDGTVTLSQRTSSGHSMPTVQASPPRVAALLESATDLTATTPKMAFTIPKNSDTVQKIIWAFGTVNPGSSAVDASFSQHADAGATTIDLTGSLSANGSTDTPTVSSGSTSIPLSEYQRLIVAHAIFSVVGFLLLLPLGALVGRYLRTFTNAWFKMHAGMQLFIAGPVIIIGFALGVQSVNSAGTEHFDDVHKSFGLAIFILYIAQCILGIVIHKFKPASSSRRRPFQNYSHAILGLLTIALAMYQVRTGYKIEWPVQTGRMPLPKTVDTVWVVLVALLSALYFIGLVLLPRQFRLERASRQQAISMGKMRGQHPSPNRI